MTSVIISVCVICGSEDGRSRTTGTCSPECRDRLWKNGGVPPARYVDCDCCCGQIDLAERKNGRLRRIDTTTCDSCRGRATRRTGTKCAFGPCPRASMKGGYCGAHYQQQRKGEDLRPLRYDRQSAKVCVVCGAEDWPDNGRRSTCSVNCTQRLSSNGGVPPVKTKACDDCGTPMDMTAQTKQGHVKRRDTRFCAICILAHKKQYEVSASFLARRDGAVCKICGDPVDMTIRKPDTQCASVDHIIPRDKGGSNAADNLQLAHLRCNQIKATHIEFTLRAVV